MDVVGCQHQTLLVRLYGYRASGFGEHDTIDNAALFEFDNGHLKFFGERGARRRDILDQVVKVVALCARQIWPDVSAAAE